MALRKVAEFDPYYQWLAIPPKDQPPNHYRLLGVNLFETNVDAIANAADQRMTHVRSFQTGKYTDLSQKLLNEIAAAKICLLNPEKRTAYDLRLRQSIAPPLPPSPVLAPPTGAPGTPGRVDFPNPPPIAPSAPATATPEPSSDRKPIWLGLGLLAGMTLVLAVVLIVKLGRGDKEVAATESKSRPTAAAPGEIAPVGSEPAGLEPERDFKEPAKPAEQGTVLPDPPRPESVKPKPGADAVKEVPPVSRPAPATNPPKPADLPPTAGITRLPPERGPPDAAPGTQQPPPSKASLPAEEKPKPNEPQGPPEEKPQNAELPAPPPEKPHNADVSTPPQKKPQSAEAPAPPQEKLAVPDEAAQKQAAAMIRETYETGYPAFDKLGLVYRLLDKAEESKSDPPARFALLQEARKLAVEAGQVELALDVIDCLAGEYQVRAAEAKAEVIEQLAKKIHSLPQRKAMVESALEVMNEAIAEDNVDLARQMGKQASQLVWPTKDRVLVQETVAQNKELEAAAKACAEAKAALAALKDNPRDPDANLVLGKHLCFAKDDWEKGLPMLARGSNAALRRWPRGTCVGRQLSKSRSSWAMPGGRRMASNGPPTGMKGPCPG